MRCSRIPCRRPAEWKPVLVVYNGEKEVRIALPVVVCSLHRDGLRRLFTGRALRRLGNQLARWGLTISKASATVEFNPLA